MVPKSRRMMKEIAVSQDISSSDRELVLQKGGESPKTMLRKCGQTQYNEDELHKNRTKMRAELRRESVNTSQNSS